MRFCPVCALPRINNQRHIKTNSRIRRALHHTLCNLDQVINGIAVLPEAGTLGSRTRALQPYTGMTGYNGIIARLQQAASDPMVDGILLDMDTPGGMVAGAFDCADIIARAKPDKSNAKSSN